MEKSNTIYLKTVVGCFIIFFFFEMIAGLGITYLNISILMATGFARICDIVGIIGLLFYSGTSLSSIGILKNKFWQGIQLGIIWSCGFGAICLIIAIGLFFWGINPFSLIHSTMLDSWIIFISYLLVGCVIGPIGEEFIFRGIVYSYFRQWGTITAIGLSTAIFIMFHSLSAGLPITQIIGGILFAMAFEQSKLLVTPIIIHIIGNTCIFLLSISTHFFKVALTLN